MKIAEILRKFADIIDQAEQQSTDGQMSPLSKGDDVNRFKQIAGIRSQNENPRFANQPKEEYADIASVTTDAGGGVNGPKHPADIRGEQPSIYPGTVYGAR